MPHCPTCGAEIQSNGDTCKSCGANTSEDGGRRQIKKKSIWLLTILGCLVALVLFIYYQFTIFVVQPIGALPNGATVIIWRTSKLNFIDSADGFCARESNGVSLLCRGAVLAAVVKKNDILLRLPYSETLYLLSTDGRSYEK